MATAGYGGTVIGPVLTSENIYRHSDAAAVAVTVTKSISQSKKSSCVDHASIAKSVSLSEASAGALTVSDYSSPSHEAPVRSVRARPSSVPYEHSIQTSMGALDLPATLSEAITAKQTEICFVNDTITSIQGPVSISVSIQQVHDTQIIQVTVPTTLTQVSIVRVTVAQPTTVVSMSMVTSPMTVTSIASGICSTGLVSNLIQFDGRPLSYLWKLSHSLAPLKRPLKRSRFHYPYLRCIYLLPLLHRRPQQPYQQMMRPEIVHAPVPWVPCQRFSPDLPA